MLSTVKEFLQISEQEKISNLLRDEFISHEFKASLRTPYPDYPEAEISKDGKETFTMGNEKFLSKSKFKLFYKI